MMQATEIKPKPLGLVWMVCHYPVARVGLAQILEREAQVYVEQKAPKEKSPSFIILSADNKDDLSESVMQIQKAHPDTPLLIFGLHPDLSLAQAALKAGARGFIHAGMTPEQIIRALKVVQKGEIVAPRALIEYLLTNEDAVGLNIFSSRQREILELLVEGLTNAQIARRVFLTESTVKQHLHAIYKSLGVKNRTEAAKIIRDDI